VARAGTPGRRRYQQLSLTQNCKRKTKLVFLAKGPPRLLQGAAGGSARGGRLARPVTRLRSDSVARGLATGLGRPMCGVETELSAGDGTNLNK
jgi:hypothetical protein